MKSATLNKQNTIARGEVLSFHYNMNSLIIVCFPFKFDERLLAQATAFRLTLPSFSCCCRNHCWLAVVLWCMYCFHLGIFHFKSFGAGSQHSQYQETSTLRVLELTKLRKPFELLRNSELYNSVPGVVTVYRIELFHNGRNLSKDTNYNNSSNDNNLY